MASSLFGNSNRSTAPFNAQSGGFGNPMQMMQQFMQFKQQMAGKDPQSMVKELMDSGKMSQQQLNDLTQKAQMLKGFLGK